MCVRVTVVDLTFQPIKKKKKKPKTKGEMGRQRGEREGGVGGRGGREGCVGWEGHKLGRIRIHVWKWEAVIRP